MARCFPSELEDDVNSAEALIVEELRKQLPDDAVIFHAVAFTDDHGECEADVVVAWPGLGIAIVEVKGGAVTVEAGVWHQADRDSKRRINPVSQAQRASHGLRRYLGEQGWGRQRKVRAVHLVAAPYSDFTGATSTHDLPRDRLIGKHDVTKIGASIANALRAPGMTDPPVTQDDVEWMCEVLAASFPSQASLLSHADEEEARCQQLTQKQLSVLDMLARHNRLEVVGGAGTGKTFIAIEKARRLARSGRQVALVCYSRGLAAYLRALTDKWPGSSRPAYVGTFHGLAVRFGIPADAGRDDDPEYWESDLPAALQSAAAAAPAELRLDDVLVDEAQDFADAWWPALLACLRDAETGGVHVFSDPDQRIFSRFSEPPKSLKLVPVDLNENVRNTEAIGRTFSSLTQRHFRWRIPHGMPVRFWQCSSSDAVSAADDAVDTLLAEGWEPGHIAVLTTYHRHPMQVMAKDDIGLEAYWDEFFAGTDVFYGNTLNFKGLERAAVILAVNGFRDDGRQREKLYVGLSRARTLLVVCGDLEEIARYGGDGIRRRLEAAKTN